MTYIPLEENTDMELTLESQEISTKQQSGGMLGPSPCSGLFDPPPATKYNFLSLGAGVQSSTLALMAAQRKLAGIKRAQKECTVTSWIGISYDEIQRMKDSREPWVQHRFPLIERKMRRHQCLEWMEAKGYPKPPRSACVYCPYHSNREWRRLRNEEPQEFARAVQFEKDLQAAHAQTDNRRGVSYLHPSRVPLEQVDLRDPDENQMQLWNHMDNECEGMCGV